MIILLFKKKTVVHTARYVFHSKWTSCCDRLVSSLCIIKVDYKARQCMMMLSQFAAVVYFILDM